MFEDFIDAVIGAAAYSVVGIGLMVLGYLVTDWLIPGKLGEQIWKDRNVNVAILLTANILSVGLIVIGAIWASAGNLVEGLVSTAVFGVIGLAAMAVSFVILDWLTPGRLGDILASDEPQPAVWVHAAMHLALGGVIAMALS